MTNEVGTKFTFYFLLNTQTIVIHYTIYCYNYYLLVYKLLIIDFKCV